MHQTGNTSRAEGAPCNPVLSLHCKTSAWPRLPRLPRDPRSADRRPQPRWRHQLSTLAEPAQGGGMGVPMTAGGQAFTVCRAIEGCQSKPTCVQLHKLLSQPETPSRPCPMTARAWTWAPAPSPGGQVRGPQVLLWVQCMNTKAVGSLGIWRWEMLHAGKSPQSFPGGS